MSPHSGQDPAAAPRWVDADAIHRALPWPALIDALQVAFAAAPGSPDVVRAPLRSAHALEGLGGADDGRALSMPAWNARHLGVKLVNVVPRNRERGAPSVSAVYVLFGDDGAPIALMDGGALTVRRTAAASALASRFLSRPAARTLLVVGTGELSPFLAEAHCAVRPFERILLWGRRPEAAVELAHLLNGRLTVPVRAVDDLDDAVNDADVITCATTSTVPLVRGAHVRPGTHVDLVGAFTREMRESDDALVAGATVFVDTRAGCLAEAGDLVQAIASGAFAAERVAAELAELCRGTHPGRASGREITVFKSVGTALEDLAAAELVASPPAAAG